MENWAARPDHIPPKALKADINTMVEILYKLFEAIWIEEFVHVPNDWKLGDLIKIPKKGDIRSCGNYIREYLSCLFLGRFLTELFPKGCR